MNDPTAYVGVHQKISQDNNWDSSDVGRHARFGRPDNHGQKCCLSKTNLTKKALQYPLYRISVSMLTRYSEFPKLDAW